MHPAATLRSRRSVGGAFCLALLCTVLVDSTARAQAAGQQRATRTIEERTTGMRRLDGFFPLYWDSAGGQLFMEITRWNTEVLALSGLAAGLGSNDIGLDRGGLQGSRVVEFERVGPKVLMVMPNYNYRSSSTNPAEVRAVRDAFARSIVWGFTVAAESDGGRRVLVDMNEYLIRDATNIAPRLTPGSYRLDNTRSTVYLPMTQNFPRNTEMEVELTFIQQPGGAAGGGRGGGAFFEGVGSVAATGEAASVRVHHSFVELPGPGYTPRPTTRAPASAGSSFEDFSAPFGQELTQRFIRRHRLEKRDPRAAVSEPVKPITYYLDPGTPEPIRTALLEGARWWNQAFESAGFRNGFRVEMLPEGASPLDIRYNVINWVHRSTRGWSSGASVTDPRTGEIIKGVVTLGSLRAEQDMLIAEGLLQPYRTGDEECHRRSATGRSSGCASSRRTRSATPSASATTTTTATPAASASSTTRTRSSRCARMGPSTTPRSTTTGSVRGTASRSSTATRTSRRATNEAQALQQILDRAWARDIRYMTNQDLGAHARVNQWSNGTNAANELVADARRETGRAVAASGRTRSVAACRWRRWRRCWSRSTCTTATRWTPQRTSSEGCTTSTPSAATVASRCAWHAAAEQTSRPRRALVGDRAVGARPSGGGRSEDPAAPSRLRAVARDVPPLHGPHVRRGHPGDRRCRARRRAALRRRPAPRGSSSRKRSIRRFRGSRTSSTPCTRRASAPRPGTPYEAEIKRAVERVVIDELIDLAGSAPMSQVRAVATLKLQRRATELGRLASATEGSGQAAVSEPAIAHANLLVADIRRFLDRPSMQVATRFPGQTAPPGAPIGDSPMDWLRRTEPACAWQDGRWWD